MESEFTLSCRTWPVQVVYQSLLWQYARKVGTPYSLASRDPKEQQAAIAPIREFFSGFPASMGINKETIPAIEGSHIESLEILNQHFLHYPYLLGGHPSFADFGLIGPLFAHLGRDPTVTRIENRLLHA